MEPDTLVLTAFNAFLVAGLSGLLWTRLNRIDDQLDRLSEQVTACATRVEVEAFRSDLTQVALAVGARQPRTAEG